MAPQTVDKFAITLTTDSLVTLRAGNGDKEFRVQRALLIKASPWFAKELKRTKETQQSCIVFDDTSTSPQTLKHFLFWLFNRELGFAQTNDIDVHQDQQHQAVRIWVFGSEHSLPALQDAAMHEIDSLFGLIAPRTSTIREAYYSSISGSVLREKVMDQVVIGLEAKAENELADGYTPAELGVLENVTGFTVDLAKHFVRVAKNSNKPATKKRAKTEFMIVEPVGSKA